MGSKHTANVHLADSPGYDAFHRLRVSDPVTLFDTQQQYNLQPLTWETSASSTTATITHLPNESSAQFTVAAGSNVTRQTFQYFRYQPGKSQLIMMTGVLGDAQAGVTKRLGYFDDENGFFFERTGTALSIVMRSKVTGSVVETRVAQADWNKDTFPELVCTNSQIFFFDLEWLGVGRVRAGIVERGVPRVLHEFYNANEVATAYMTTANLPVRYFCGSTGGGSTSSDMRQICTTVIAEGGFEEENGVPQTTSTLLAGVTVTSTAEKHVLSMRPALTFNGIATRGHVVFEDVDMITRTNDVRFRLLYNVGLSTGSTAASSWTNNSTANSMVEVATGSTVTVTGGVPVKGGWSVAGSGNRAQAVTEKALLSKLPLALDKAGTAQRGLSLLAQARTGSAVVHASFNWREIY